MSYIGSDPDDPSRPRGNPRPITPDRDPSLRPNYAPGQSLVESLGATVDSLRQQYTDVGLRPYRVVAVVVRWTGGAVGVGTQEVVSSQEILPTPKVEADGLRGEMTSAGRQEKGGVTISEISPRYTEDDIYALFGQQPLPLGHQAFWDLFIDGRDGQTVRRRLVPQGPPVRDAGKFQWRGRFVRQDEDESRTNVPSSLTKRPEQLLINDDGSARKVWT